MGRQSTLKNARNLRAHGPSEAKWRSEGMQLCLCEAAKFPSSPQIVSISERSDSRRCTLNAQAIYQSIAIKHLFQV